MPGARVAVPAGAWEPLTPDLYGGGSLGFIVIEGLVTRDLWIGERSMTQIFGPGDPVMPWPAVAGSVPPVAMWNVSEHPTLALLDDQFTAASRRWPSLGSALHRLLVEHGDRAALQAAIAQLPRVDQRLLAMLWHLADRFGRVSADGVVLPLDLTHETLGRLVGGQRPTITLALGELAKAGTVARRADRTWLLAPLSADDLATGPASLARWGAPHARML